MLTRETLDAHAAQDTPPAFTSAPMSDEAITLLGYQRTKQISPKSRKSWEAGNPVPENLRKQLERSQSQLRENEAYIARQIKDRKALNEQFDQDVARFRELKGLPPEAAEEAAEEAQEEVEEQTDSDESSEPAPADADGQSAPVGE